MCSFKILTKKTLLYCSSVLAFDHCSHSWLNFGHMKAKIWLLVRRLSPSRFDFLVEASVNVDAVANPFLLLISCYHFAARSSNKSDSYQGPVLVGKMIWDLLAGYCSLTASFLYWTSYGYGIHYHRQDLNNTESDPEDFAKTFCADMGIEDPEVGVRESE